MGVVVVGADRRTRQCPYLVLDAHEYEINVAKNLEGFNGPDGSTQLQPPPPHPPPHPLQPVPQLEYAFSVVSLFSAGFFNFMLDVLPRFVLAQTSGLLPPDTVVIVSASKRVSVHSTAPT